jgi:AcrR family transcriptional regulator
MSDPVLEHVAEPSAQPTDTAQDPRRPIIAAAIEVLHHLPFHHMTLDRVAATAGLDVAEVAALFPTTDELTVAVIEVWNGRRMAPILPIAHERGAAAFLRAIVAANVEDPALMRLLAAVASIAASPTLPMAETLRTQWIRFHALVQRALAHDVATGREPATMEPARGAEQLIALYEGLQLQSMVRPHLDVLEAYDRAVTRLRDGWSKAYVPPVWEI